MLYPSFMKTRKWKRTLYKEVANVTKALSNAHRLEILDLLSQGSFPVEYIAEQTQMPAANASQHLQVLKKSGLVKTLRRGKYIHYELKSTEVFETWLSLQQLSMCMNTEIKALLGSYRDCKKQHYVISSDDLVKKMHSGNIILLDVRPAEEFNNGHIKNAVSWPFRKRAGDVQALPHDREIIAYCRGPLCLMADEAVWYLRKKGFHASRLENGFTGWLERSKSFDLQ